MCMKVFGWGWPAPLWLNTLHPNPLALALLHSVFPSPGSALPPPPSHLCCSCLVNVLVEVEPQQLLPLCLSWQVKVDGLIHAVQHSIIKVTRTVGGQDNHEVTALVT